MEINLTNLNGNKRKKKIRRANGGEGVGFFKKFNYIFTFLLDIEKV